MSNRRDYMQRGYFVAHKYGPRRPGRHGQCVRCGVKRRSTSSGWEWQGPGGRWVSTNPPCAKKDGPC